MAVQQWQIDREVATHGTRSPLYGRQSPGVTPGAGVATQRDTMAPLFSDRTATHRPGDTTARERDYQAYEPDRRDRYDQTADPLYEMQQLEEEMAPEKHIEPEPDMYSDMLDFVARDRAIDPMELATVKPERPVDRVVKPEDEYLKTDRTPRFVGLLDDYVDNLRRVEREYMSPTDKVYMPPDAPATQYRRAPAEQVELPPTGSVYQVEGATPYRRAPADMPREVFTLPVDEAATDYARPPAEPVELSPMPEVPPEPEAPVFDFGEWQVTSPYDVVRELEHHTEPTLHVGVDLIPAHGAKRIGTPIKSVVDGEVVSSSKLGGRGHTVKVRDDRGYTHIFQHLHGPSPHNVGDRVRKGDVLGQLGASGNVQGEIEGGAHLHYEVWNPQGGHVNPIPFLEGIYKIF